MIKKIIQKIQALFSKPKLPLVATTNKPSTTTIKIFVKDKLVGVVQSLSIIENSRYKDHPLIETSRVRFDRARIEEAFSRGFLHPHAQKVPLQMEIDDGEVITKCKNVWTENNRELRSYQTEDWIITENLDLVAEEITSKKK